MQYFKQLYEITHAFTKLMNTTCRYSKFWLRLNWSKRRKVFHYRQFSTLDVLYSISTYLPRLKSLSELDSFLPYTQSALDILLYCNKIIINNNNRSLVEFLLFVCLLNISSVVIFLSIMKNLSYFPSLLFTPR